MACEINAGFDKDCAYSLAGVERLYLGNHGDFTYNKNSGGTVTGITAVSGATFYQYDFNLDSCIGTSDLTIGTNNRRYINQTVTFSSDVNGQSAVDIMDSLGLATVDVILVTREGEVELYGEYGGLTSSVGQMSTGGALGDAAGASVTLIGAAKSYKTFISSSVSIPV